jgi:predicted acylesterase/phospholipase RssA
MKLFDDGPVVRRRTTSPTVAIALGGGGARGLAHIVALEALEELGIRPVVIAGTSIGAIVGATFASGLEARQIHAHVKATLRSRARVMAKLMRARVGRFSDLVFKGGGNPVLLDAETCLDLFLARQSAALFQSIDDTAPRRRDGLSRVPRSRLLIGSSGARGGEFHGDTWPLSARAILWASADRRRRSQPAALRSPV